MNDITTSPQSGTSASANRVAFAMPAIFAVVFGMFVVYGVGFAHPSTIHNAAHDARHAFAFPCH